MAKTVSFVILALLRIGGGNQGNSDDLEKMELLQALEKCTCILHPSGCFIQVLLYINLYHLHFRLS